MRKLAAAAAFCAALSCKQPEAARPPEPPQAPPPPAVLAPPEKVKEQEPDDYQHAQQIPSRAVVDGSLAPPRPKAADDDWYRVAAGVGKTLALRLDLKQVGEAPLDAWLEVYDRDRNRLLRVHAGGEDKGVVPAVACAEACFVKVSGSAAAAYALTVLGAPPEPGRELEPNNRAVDANELPAGKPMQGTFLSGDDEDWYRLSLAAVNPGEFLRVELTGVEGVRPELEVRALADGALLASMRAGAAGEALFVRDLSLHLGERRADAGVPDAGIATEDSGVAADADGGAPDAAAAPAQGASAPDAAPPPPAAPPPAAPPPPAAQPPAAPPPPAGYYLVLKSGWLGKNKRGAAPLVPYTLTAAVEAGPADLEQEPNDDLQHATPAQASATGYLSPSGDQDWYRISNDAPSVLHAEVTGLERVDLELSVYGPPFGDEKPPLLARANEGGAKEGEVLPAVGVPAGDSYVLVQAAARNLDGKWVREGEDRQTPYKLTLALTPDDGSTDREPNNELATAQVIVPPATVKGWIWPRKDVDVYRFHVGPGRPPVNITLPAVRGLDLQLKLMEIHGDKAEVIGSSDSAHGEGDEKLLSVPLKEGEYAVEVSSPRGKDASATQQYLLTVQ